VIYSSDYRGSRSLKEVSASPEYFRAIASLVGQLPVKTSAPELVLALRDATRRLGADASFFASFIREDRDFNSFRFLVACDPVWSLQYEVQNCVSADPWLRYARSHTEAARAVDLLPANEQEQQTIGLAAKYGFKSAFIVPAPACSGSRLGVLVLGSGQADFFHDDGVAALKVVARGLAMELHERFADLMQRELMTRWDLTAFELELLSHQHEGRPTKVIASLLGCSIGAIDQRFHRLNGKLGVSSRGHAARLAAAYGLI
jgi:DNA-binding CsgD family transcriptional regulator